MGVEIVFLIDSGRKVVLDGVLRAFGKRKQATRLPGPADDPMTSASLLVRYDSHEKGGAVHLPIKAHNLPTDPIACARNIRTCVKKSSRRR